TGLVQKSMAVADRLEDGSTRYRLMESHRDFAHGKLEESGELEEIQRRHYEHFLSQRWKARESANFWAALGWARDKVDDAGLALAIKLAESEFFDQVRLRNALLDRLELAPTRDAGRARALNLAARLASRQADHAASKTLADESVELARELGDAELTAYTLRGAAASWEESLAILRDLNDRFGIIWSVGGLALVAAARKDDERALRLAAVVDRLSRESLLSTWSFRVKELNEMSDRIRNKLGPSKSEAVWTGCQTMNLTRALEYALGGSAQAASAAAESGPLSRREREVAARVAGGWTNREIAQRLFIAERTAAGHVVRIRNKLRVRSRTEVATWAVAHGLVPQQP